MPSGAVQLDPPGRAFGQEDNFDLCEYTYTLGECDVRYAVEEGKPRTLKLTALPGPSQTFERWSWPGCATGPVCTIQLTAGDEPTEIWAVFTPARFSVLTAGLGTVTGASGTINCTVSTGPDPDPGSDCGESSFAAGTPLTLTAQGAGGRKVTWVFGCDPGENPNASTCTFFPENRYIGVRFGDTSGPAPPFDVKVSLRVIKSGSGSGSVTGGAAEAGGGTIECGSTCRATPGLNFGVRVKLTADAAPGSHFVRWTGAPCTTQSTCVLNAGPITSLGAVFDANAPPTPPPSPPPATTAPPGTTATTTTTTTTAPPPPTTTLRARLRGVSWRRVGGRYRVLAQVEVTKLATARLRVVRGTRQLGQRTVTMGRGRATLWVALARSAHAGPGTLQIRFGDRDGQVVTLSRRVVVGR